MKNFLGIMILAFLCGTPSYSNSLEKEFLIKVDGICVQNIDNIKMINIFANTDKWINLPPEQAAMIAPRTKGPSYKAYGFFENEIVYLIGINDAENKNTCTMASSYNSINDIKSILKEFYKIELLHKENQGIQNIEMYKVNLTQSFNNSGILVLNYSEQTGYKFISISVMIDNG
jgi:hypothetical protein|tara:strand:- start:280 stop:801 length:522 start_codon:yes stop_codon:yes gene_type:complete